jgi:hypothetical protein
MYTYPLETGGFEDDFNQRPFDFDAAMAPARDVRLNFARDTSSHAAWRAAGAPEDDLQVPWAVRGRGEYNVL